MKTCDGAGVSTQIPYKLFIPEVQKLGHKVYQESDLGVGMIFLPHDNAYAQARAKAIIEEVVEQRGLFLFGWREVPINIRVLGEKAASTLPRIEQVFIGRPHGMSDDDYERRLFLARNEIENRAEADQIKHFYIPSFSHRTISIRTASRLRLRSSSKTSRTRPTRRRAAVSLALFHQHLPDVAARASVPHVGA